jgi:hypothetical protein
VTKETKFSSFVLSVFEPQSDKGDKIFFFCFVYFEPQSDKGDKVFSFVVSVSRRVLGEAELQSFFFFYKK